MSQIELAANVVYDFAVLSLLAWLVWRVEFLNADADHLYEKVRQIWQYTFPHGLRETTESGKDIGVRVEDDDDEHI